jgi:hypothetical protein
LACSFLPFPLVQSLLTFTGFNLASIDGGGVVLEITQTRLSSRMVLEQQPVDGAYEQSRGGGNEGRARGVQHIDNRRSEDMA